MRFCDQCWGHMQKSTASGSIQFTCKCNNIIPGEDNDSLMSEGILETAESYQKHEVFMENSVHDKARFIVESHCPKCKIDHLTMVRVGVQQNIIYICTCGYSATLDNHSREK